MSEKYESEIAVVGIAGRFPGANNIEEFFENLQKGKNNIIDVPKTRWELHETQRGKMPGKTVQKGHDKCDNVYFGIGEDEAHWMDPQQYLALEVTQNALEDAGLTKEDISGTHVAVFIGEMNHDLGSSISDASHNFNNYVATGTASSITANRISRFYNLHGPSVTLDTACSSSLVAVHFGIQSLQSGDSEMAICGGVNVILNLANYIILDKAAMISRTGKSLPFTKEANGYVRGEGCGIVILKPYKKAISDKNKIWGIVKTCCNQNGKSSKTFTAPSELMQSELLKTLCDKALITAADIQYIEAHGTGTKLGDLTEVNALTHFLKGNGIDESVRKIPMGSVKSNIGHLESAAGVASLIKVLLMMKYSRIVPSLHFSDSTCNPDINFANIPIKVNTELMEWPSINDDKKIALVNSFGFGGTNCIALIKSVSQVEDKMYKESETFCFDRNIITFTAKSLNSLQKAVKSFLENSRKIQRNPNIEDLSFTSLVKRDHYIYRIATVATSLDELENSLAGKLEHLKEIKPVTKSNQFVVFAFCGVGTVWKGMCKNILLSSSIFRNTLDDISKELQKYTNINMLTVFNDFSENHVRDSFIGPICIFACQVALWRVWRHLGVEPDAIFGVSIGEVAAAHAAGCLSLEDAVKLTYYRSFLTSKNKTGKLLVVGNIDIGRMQEICNKYKGKVCIAVYSSPETCVISGDFSSVTSLEESLKSRAKSDNILLKDLGVDCAYHSHHMKDPGEKLIKELKNFKGSSPIRRIFSTMTGKEISGDEMGCVKYWSSNLENPVLLSETVQSVFNSNDSGLILEIGPRPILRAHIKKITQKNILCLSSLDSPHETKTFLETCASLYCYGKKMNLNAISGNGKFADMPLYIFNRNCELHAAKTVKQDLNINFNYDQHQALIIEETKNRFVVQVLPSIAPYIFQHWVADRKIVPGAIYAEMSFEVIKRSAKTNIYKTAVSLQFTKLVSVQDEVTIVFEIDTKDNCSSFEIRRKQDVVCKGWLLSSTETTVSHIDIKEKRKQMFTSLSKEDVYKLLEKIDFKYGPLLQVISCCVYAHNEYLAYLDVANCSLDGYNLHPVVLDGALQTAVLLWNMLPEPKAKTPVPVKIGNIKVRGQVQDKMVVYGRLVQSSNTFFVQNMVIASPSGEIIVEIQEFRLEDVSASYVTNKSNEIGYEMALQSLCEIKIKHLSTDYSNRVIVVFSLSDVWFKQMGEICEVSKTLFLDKSKITEDNYISNILEQNNHFLKKATDIVYFTGLDDIVSTADSQQIFEQVTVTCITLMKLLQTSFNMGFKGDMFVVTRNVHCACNKTVQSTNSIDSALTGMSRCIARDRTCKNIRLTIVDIENESDLALLPSIVCNKEKFKNYPELKISDMCLYENIIQRKDNKEEAVARCNSYNALEMVEVLSKRTDSLHDLFLVQTEHINLKEEARLEIEVKELYIDKSLNHCTFSQDERDLDIWKETRQSGHRLIVTEFVGHDKSNPMNSNKTYVGCRPYCASNVVHMQESCLVPMSLLKAYYPCLLTNCILGYSLLENLYHEMTVVIVNDVNDQRDRKLFHDIITTICPTIQFELETDDRSIQTDFQIVLLTNNVSTFLEKSFNKDFKKLRKVVTFSHLVNPHNEHRLRTLFYMKHISVIQTEEAFCEVKLVQYIKEIKLWANAYFERNHKLFSQTEGNKQTVTTIRFEGANIPNVVNAESLPLQTCMKSLFSKKAIYIVVGGTKGLGWHIVKIIAKQGGGAVGIISRTKGNDVKEEAERLSIETNCSIIFTEADVSDYKSIKHAFDFIQRTAFPFPIKGVFHSAANVQDASLPMMTRAKFEDVLLPKVLGTLNLHNIIKDFNLDYFVLHSSITAITGNEGQMNYGAGNAFQDGFVCYRRSLGLCGQTINWGPLSIGVVKRENLEEQLRSQGYIPLSEEQISTCFMKTLLSNNVQSIYGNFNWNEILTTAGFDKPYLMARCRPIVHAIKVTESVIGEIKQEPFINRTSLTELPEDQQKGKLSEMLLKLLSKNMPFELSDATTSTELAMLGMDSMKAISLMNEIEKNLQCTVSIISILETGATTNSISEIILAKIRAEKNDLQ